MSFHHITVESPTRTTSEAAAYLCLKPTTLEQWRWQGRGPLYIKLGRCVRYRQCDLDDFMAARLFRNTTEASASEYAKKANKETRRGNARS